MKFWRSCTPGKGVCGRKILALPYYSHHGLCASMGGLRRAHSLCVSERFFIFSLLLHQPQVDEEMRSFLMTMHNYWLDGTKQCLNCTSYQPAVETAEDDVTVFSRGSLILMQDVQLLDKCVVSNNVNTALVIALSVSQ